MSAKIELPRSLVVGLVGVAALAVLGMIFLLGRESGRTHPGEPKAGLGTATLAPVPASTTTAPIPPRPDSSSPPPSEPVGQAMTMPSVPPISPSDATRASVAAYFQAVEAIQPAASGDPETVAQQVLAGLGKGDMSGFESMIQQAQATRDHLSTLTPPQPCAAYHRDSLASLDAGLALMRDMKRALSSAGQDTAASNLADRANALKARTDALQLQEHALKQRYGLL